MSVEDEQRALAEDAAILTPLEAARLIGEGLAALGAGWRAPAETNDDATNAAADAVVTRAIQTGVRRMEEVKDEGDRKGQC